VPEAFLEFNVNLMSIYVLQGVGKKVRIRELMGIASADDDDDHVISVKKYNNLKDAIKKAVYIKIGTSNSLASKYFFGKNVSFPVPLKKYNLGILSKDHTWKTVPT